MKIEYTILLIFLASFISIKAQDTNGFNNVNPVPYRGEIVELKRPIDYKHVTGSPFHVENFMKGVVVWSDGDTTHRYMRYNAYTDEIEYVEEEKVKILFTQNDLDRVWLNNLVYREVSYISDNRINESFMIELVDGVCRLFKRDWIDFQARVEAVTSYHQATPDKFVEKPDEFYYSCDNNNLLAVPTAKKDLKLAFEKSFPGHAQFIKQNKLKLRREEDLLKFFAYLNGEAGK